jgi:hypothetical protein
MSVVNMAIRTLDWEQAPSPSSCDRSLTIVFSPSVERSQDITQGMASYYPRTMTFFVLNTDRSHRLYSNAEWMDIARHSSGVLRSLAGKGNQDHSHVVVYAQDVDFVPRQLLACADLTFWYNGTGEPSQHQWCLEQINKYMKYMTSLQIGDGFTAVLRKNLVDANAWAASCHHWIGSDIRCKQRTWITLPLTQIESNLKDSTEPQAITQP